MTENYRKFNYLKCILFHEIKTLSYNCRIFCNETKFVEVKIAKNTSENHFRSYANGFQRFSILSVIIIINHFIAQPM